MAEILNDDPVFVSSVHYRDPAAAVEFLERAFGFELTMAIEGPPEAPEMCHYEMALNGRGRVMVGGEFESRVRSPASIDGTNTQRLHVQLPGELEAHCEHARAAGAEIVMEPEGQFYGDVSYRALDSEGHSWTFSVHVRDVTKAEAEAAIGVPIASTTWH
ncbi:MAG: VOC family protein [Microthrixaceae bacterium]